MSQDGTRPVQTLPSKAMALGTPPAQACPENLSLVPRSIIHHREYIQGEGIFDDTVETREDFGEDGPG